MIPSIVTELDPRTVMLLANAVYFKGAWRSPFARAATRPGTFHAPSGDVETPMMRAGGSWAYAEDDRAQILWMPHGRGRFAMTMVLPLSARGGGGGDGSGGGLEALMRALVGDFERASALGKPIPQEVLMAAGAIEEPGRLAGSQASHRLCRPRGCQPQLCIFLQHKTQPRPCIDADLRWQAQEEDHQRQSCDRLVRKRLVRLSRGGHRSGNGLGKDQG